MGLSIVLERHRGTEREFVGLNDQMRSKVSFGVKVSRFYEAYFKVNRIEIWKYATLKELEGVSFGGLETPDKFVTREKEEELLDQLQKLTIPDLFFSIVRLVGTWGSNGSTYEGYVSISNAPSWARVYGDVELNVFAKGNVRDIVDILYSSKTTKERLVDFFLDSFGDFNDGIFKVKGIYFALGVPSAEDFDLWRTAFISSQTKLLEDAITALKATGEEEIKRRLSPYSVSYIVRNLRETPRFENTLHTFFEEHKILERELGSVGYIGEEAESFKKLFVDLSEKVLKPVIFSLPPETDIASRIRNTIDKQATLS